MQNLTDEDLLNELRFRFELNQNTLSELLNVSRDLETLNCKLQASESMKGHFLSNIRNEINNPLTSISGLARHLMNGEYALAQVKELAGMIYSEAFDLDFQLRNIFVAAELEAGEARPEFCNVEAEDLLHNTLELLASHLAAKHINVIETFSNSKAPERFVTDAQMLQVMLMNLLMNAIKFSPIGGTVHVGLNVASEVLKISVADNGCGIDPVDQIRIFDRFMQKENGSTKGHRGHGLGLSITRALVELLGGRVSVESLLGAGAKFSLEIPQPQLDAPVLLNANDGNFFVFSADGSDNEQFF